VRLLVTIGLSVLLAACTAAAPSSTEPSVPSSTASASPEISQAAPGDAVPSPAPSGDAAATESARPSQDAGLVDAALSYAATTGFEIETDAAPTVDDRAPGFDSVVLHHVSLVLAGGDGATLDVYLDDDGAIRVVEDGLYLRPIGAAVSRSEAVKAAEGHLRAAGVDPADGTIHVAMGEPGQHWYLTLDREIDGYRVANAPMGWWLSGDKAYLELRPDGSLANLYVIRPGAEAAPQILDRVVLDAGLAETARNAFADLAAYDRELLWVRAMDRATGVESATLRLAYCATYRWDYGWEAWCVDAGTGEYSTQGSGVD
jgi:hypothetical protein